MHELNVVRARQNHEAEVEKIVERLNSLGYEIESYDATHVLTYGDEVVGAFHLMDELTPDKGVKRIKWLVASKSSENRGLKVGNKALFYIIEYCINNNVRKIFVSVRETNNRAIHLYQKYNFEFTERKEGKEIEMVQFLTE